MEMATMIKFRAWSKEEECWVSIDSIVLDSNDSIAYLLPEADDQPPYLEEEVEIMQYIGLKDANGKEIYESDILRVTTGEDGESYIATVKWFGDEDYPAFDLEGIPAAWNYDANALATIFQSGVEACEVIGNIYDTL